MCTVEWSSLVSDLDIGERQKKTTLILNISKKGSNGSYGNMDNVRWRNGIGPVVRDYLMIISVVWIPSNISSLRKKNSPLSSMLKLCPACSKCFSLHVHINPHRFTLYM